jgi:hypothetical protein
MPSDQKWKVWVRAKCVPFETETLPCRRRCHTQMHFNSDIYSEAQIRLCDGHDVNSHTSGTRCTMYLTDRQSKPSNQKIAQATRFSDTAWYGKCDVSVISQILRFNQKNDQGFTHTLNICSTMAPRPHEAKQCSIIKM